jgi:glycosyltransferase involved in cell wall biosynthesis
MFELIRRLDRSRFQSLVATFKPGGELEPQLRSLGITPMVFPLKGSLTRPNTLIQIARMAALCRREKVSIVHSHDFYSNVVGTAAASVGRVRAIASRRDLAHWLNPIQRRALLFSLRLADCVVANAQAVGELAARSESVPAEKLQVIPNGIDIARFDAMAKRPPDPPLPDAHGRPRVVMVASMHLPDKGHADLLEAAAQLMARGVRAQYLFVSDGALRAGLEERAAELGLSGEVLFLGRRTDVPAILSKVDLVVLPSWAEGFPNVVMEAMCASRPVLATRVGGIPEVLSDGVTGRLIEPRRADQLAEAIAEMLADPKRLRAFGRAGRLRVEESFSLERMTAAVQWSTRGSPPDHARPSGRLTPAPVGRRGHARERSARSARPRPRACERDRSTVPRAAGGGAGGGARTRRPGPSPYQRSQPAQLAVGRAVRARRPVGADAALGPGARLRARAAAERAIDRAPLRRADRGEPPDRRGADHRRRAVVAHHAAAGVLPL